MKNFSYHIFMFPFQWSVKGKESNDFTSQIDLEGISYVDTSMWMRSTRQDSSSLEQDEVLYNESNYFYRFVHDALYDNGKNGHENLIRHFERREPIEGDVSYVIAIKDKEYRLRVDCICLDLISTGVGVLIMYVANDLYADFQDVLNINQFGRRVYPPFYDDKHLHYECARRIGLEGMLGDSIEDFSSYTTKDFNRPAGFLLRMINEIASDIIVNTVIDDRMYVMSWYRNNELAQRICRINENTIGLEDFEKEYADWYRYVFVDASVPSCHNAGMFNDLIRKSTYRRWQEWNSLYGISRYSFVLLSNAGDSERHLYDYFETEYVRMTELVLIQKASILKFSQEVTNISILDKRTDFSARVDSLYKEYIRFVNQIHFREVSAQDQAIELYEMLYDQMNIGAQVEKLDAEIDELHTYVELCEDRKKSQQMDKLSKIGFIVLPISLMTGFYGMNSYYNKAGDNCDAWISSFAFQWISILVVVLVFYLYIIYISKKRR